MRARVHGAAVMVTGGCGFIGSHLVRRLVADGARKVVVVDGMRTGDRKNLGAALESAAVEIVRFTLGTDPVAALEPHVRKVEYLFHLAAEKHHQALDRPASVLAANVLGTQGLFELAARSGVRKTVFTSSLYAYGRVSPPACAEDDIPSPTTVYGISKLCGELLLAHAARGSRMQTGVLRYFFVYGPRQFAGTGYKSVVVRNFERIRAGEPPVVFGDGAQRLDYVFVDDVVEATVRCMVSGAAGETFNVGSGVPTSINELTAAMLGVARSPLVPVHAAPDETAGTFRVGRVEKIAAALGWSPRVSLEDGLAQTWRWMTAEADGR